MTAAIEAVDLKKVFKGGVRALDGVSFSVEQGTVFGLLGPNGAGKTTAVRVLTTVIAADSGSARVLGHDVARDPELVRTLFGLAGQYAAVDENLTGRENLVMIGRLNHMTKPAVALRSVELLDQFGLQDAADRPLKTYSGGMRRRLDLAAALVAGPSVLFLDEPTTGLDPQSRASLWAVIEELVEAGTTVLLTTQYLEEADRLAKQIAVVDHGRVISEGSPTELKAALGATVLEIGLHDEATANEVLGALSHITTKQPRQIGKLVEVPVDGGPKIAMEALRALDQRGIEPASFTLREPSLDDVFLSLTGRKAEVQDLPSSDDNDGAPRQRRGHGSTGRDNKAPGAR